MEFETFHKAACSGAILFDKATEQKSFMVTVQDTAQHEALLYQCDETHVEMKQTARSKIRLKSIKGRFFLWSCNIE